MIRAGSKRNAAMGWLAAATMAAAVLAQSACIRAGSSATFDRTLKVQELVRLEVSSGSGRVVVRKGQAGSVHVHGEVHVGGLMMGNAERRAQEIAANPPIDQSGSLVRLGGRFSDSPFQGLSISYTVEAPADTQVSLKAGSGDVEISGLDGPVNVIESSGSVRVDEIKDNVTIMTGSGAIRASRIQGSVSFTTGSASATFSEIREDVRGNSGSGVIEVDRAQGRVNVHTGSGRIRVTGAAEDVRAGTGSGSIEIRGNPGKDAFWDLGTSSGEIALAVPDNASFAVTAHTSSGNVHVDMPISIEEQSRKFLRARVGDGQAHVNLETRSGNIRIVRGGAS